MKTMKWLIRACALALILMMALSGAAAAQSRTKRYDSLGLSVTYDEALEEKYFGMFGGFYDAHDNAYLSLECIDPEVDERTGKRFQEAYASGDQQAMMAAIEEFQAHLNEIATVYMMDRADYDAYRASGTMPFDETGMTGLGEHNGYLYWADFADLNAEGKRETQSETEIANWLEVAAALGDLSGMIEFIPVVRQDAIAEGEQFPAFVTTDMQGNEVTDAIFAQKELTVVNFWATTCGPCIKEMPELGEWASGMPENMQLIGIVVDVMPGDTRKIDKVEQIMDKANAGFINLMMDDALLAYSNARIAGTPTTILINSRGEVVSDAILGAYIEKYKQAVETYFDGQ